MRSIVSIMFLIFISANVRASIQLTNGNFDKSFLDLPFTKNNSLINLQRTYNSTSDLVGHFGFGWSNLYETKITPQGGIIILYENGNGRRRIFRKTGNSIYRDKGTQTQALIPLKSGFKRIHLSRRIVPGHEGKWHTSQGRYRPSRCALLVCE